MEYRMSQKWNKTRVSRSQKEMKAKLKETNSSKLHIESTEKEEYHFYY